ncbi:MAG: trypsin-like peptidase domain-containing protein [Deltaproteobacteria bacterium]|nr:trypsin-like peptidase domain-containing protein [Deltaproteobacteria bacterium]
MPTLRVSSSFVAACLLSTACAEDGPPVSPSVADRPIVYGADDRLDLYQVTDPVLRRVADATAILLDKGLVTASGGGYTIDSFRFGTYGDYFDLCPSERFYDQPTPGYCSGFLVGPDLFATAGHCISKPGDCSGTAIVFDYAMHTDATTYPSQVPASDVYFCESIVSRSNSPSVDYSIVKLDRPVTGGAYGRAPLRIRRDADGLPEDDARVAGMVSLSYPSGIPLKIKGGPEPIPNRQVGGVEIEASYTNYFEVGADVAAGSSGSVLVSFDHEGRLLFAEGNLVRGNPDFVNTGTCYVTAVCDYETGCSGGLGSGWEEYNRSTTWDQHVPALSACDVDPDGCSFVVDQLGDACWDSGDTRNVAVDFGCGPAAAPRGSVHLETRVGQTADKATLDRRVWTAGDGCDVSPVGDALADVQSIAYTWFVESDGAYTFAAPALKLLIDTSEANPTTAGDPRLENAGDKIMVFEPYLQDTVWVVEDIWTPEIATRTSGRWWLVDLTPGGSPALGAIARSDLRTLDAWTTALAAAGAPTIVSLQIGVGSGNAGLKSWVDDLAYASTHAAFDVDMESPIACTEASGSEGAAVLEGTASFVERGVAKTAADKYVKVAASDVVGATTTDKDATLALLGGRLRAAVAEANGKSGRARDAVLRARINALRKLADADLGGDPSDDLLTGAAAVTYRTMLDRARAALD